MMPINIFEIVNNKTFHLMATTLHVFITNGLKEETIPFLSLLFCPASHEDALISLFTVLF